MKKIDEILAMIRILDFAQYCRSDPQYYQQFNEKIQVILITKLLMQEKFKYDLFFLAYHKCIFLLSFSNEVLSLVYFYLKDCVA